MLVVLATAFNGQLTKCRNGLQIVSHGFFIQEGRRILLYVQSYYYESDFNGARDTYKKVRKESEAVMFAVQFNPTPSVDARSLAAPAANPEENNLQNSSA